MESLFAGYGDAQEPHTRPVAPTDPQARMFDHAPSIAGQIAMSTDATDPYAERRAHLLGTWRDDA